MSAIVNRVGQKHNMLTVVGRSPKSDQWGQSIWICECECGNTTSVTTSNLSRSLVVSCGCYKDEQLIKHNTRNAPPRDLPRGVYHIQNRKHEGKYRAAISIGNKVKHLGYFDSPEEAHAAYLKKVEEVD